MRRRTVVAMLAVLALTASAPAETFTCKATRDVWLSAANKREVGCNMGAARTIKLKVWQEFGIVDFDVSALKGKKVTEAWLHLKPGGGAKLKLNGGTDLRWLTVSTVSHEWVEGKSTSYRPDPKGKGASFNEWSHGKGNWGFEGAKCWDVILGNGNTIRMDGWMDSVNGWLKLKLERRLVQAMIAGATHGLLVMDGSSSVGVNCTVLSRESGKGPYLTVKTDGDDFLAPAEPTNVTVTPAPNHATPKFGAAIVSLRVPAGVLAYKIKVNGEPLGRWQIPFAAKAGSTQSFPILDLPSNGEIKLEIASVDGAGNVSKSVSAVGKAGPKLTVPRLPVPALKPAGGPPKALGGAKVWALPEITKIHPVTGKLLGEKAVGDIRRANAVWDGAGGTVRLAAARGEIVSFQVVVEGPATRCKLAVSDLAGPGSIPASGVKLWRNWYVSGHAEYALPLTGTFDCPSADNGIEGQKLQAVTVDIHVPTGAKAGSYIGAVALTAGDAQARLALKIKVYDVVIPDEVHFNPELNCYGGPGRAGSAKFKDSFRLAHYHRCTINRVPYSQNGRVHGDWIPKVDGAGHVIDWATFDANLGGLLDGSWFAGNPRKGQPVPTLYLPMFDGWPKNYKKHYRPGPGLPIGTKDRDLKLKHDIMARPIDEAMDQAFKDAWVNCTADFVAHAKAKGWNQTLFELYLNNKPKYGYTMWTLDEPFEYLDWAALNFFGKLFKKGVNDPEVYTLQWQQRLYRQGLAKMNRSRPTFVFRGDVSRPMWQGNCSDGLMTMLYSGGVFTTMPRLLRNTKTRAPLILYAYGSCNDPARSNWESAAWCLKTFALNGDGVLPWQSLGGKSALNRLAKTSLIIDAGKYGHAVASFRVHALRRGAQDCELLRLLQLKKGWSREHLGLLVSQKVPLTSVFKQAFSDEAAAVTFGTITSQGFCQMKEGVLQLLSE